MPKVAAILVCVPRCFSPILTVSGRNEKVTFEAGIGNHTLIKFTNISGVRGFEPFRVSGFTFQFRFEIVFIQQQKAKHGVSS
jgi:hypothetical protein